MGDTVKYVVIILIFFYAANVRAQEVSVSAEAFGVLPEISNIKISPKGDKLLYLQNVDGKIFAVTRSLSDLSEQPTGIPFDDGNFFGANWLSNDTVLVFGRKAELSKGGTFVQAESFMVAMDWKGNNRKVWYYPYLVSILEDDPQRILIRGSGGAYKLNVFTGEEEKLPGGRLYYSRVTVDKDDQIRFGLRREQGFARADNRFTAYYRKSVEDEWIELYRYERTYGLGKKARKVKVQPYDFQGFTPDPDIIYVSKKAENGRVALYTFNVVTEEFIEKVASNDHYDLTAFEFDDNDVLEKYYYYDERPRRVWVGENGQKMMRIFQSAFPNQTVRVQSSSADKKRHILKVTAPTDPGTFYLLDLNNNKIDMLTYNYKSLDVEKLSEMTPISYSARDGLLINGYLSLPKGADNKPLPTIIMPHGGPLARDNWGFDYWVQFLTTRGYAVLQMNYRGSTGYGQEFMEKGYHEWGRKMLEDINDGTKWMIEQGYADPENICIVGASYGGYAALQGAIKDPALYKCSVAFAPVTNLRKEFQFTITTYMESQEWSKKEASPSDNVDKLNLPILMFQGDLDENVDVDITRRFYKKMRNRGKDITYFEFEGEDHYLKNQKYRIKMLSEMEKFLEKHLKD